MKNDKELKEFRIYFECYEQAKHFIEPIIKKVNGTTTTKLVKLNTRYISKYKYSNSLQNILKFKVPDIIVTAIIDDREYPMFVLELSEAVTTEDHELQRFEGYLSALSGNCYYIKISPLKESQSNHGGNIEYDIVEPYAVIYKKYNHLSMHFEWPVEDDNSYVKRNEKYLSCPIDIENFTNFVKTQVSEVIINTSEIYDNDDYYKTVNEEVQKLDFISKWIDKLKAYKIDNDPTSHNSSRLSWQENGLFGKHLLFKFNRMGHSMDPERGMLWFFKLKYDDVDIISRIKFPSTGDEIFSKINLENDIDYLQAFVRGSNFFGDRFFSFLERKGLLVNSKLKSNDLDITDFLNTVFPSLNKPSLSIFSNSAAFLIQDKNDDTKITLRWTLKHDPFKTLDNVNVSHLEKLNAVDEDLVTYIVAHNVLKMNDVKLLSLSYPGAQGDRAVLTAPGTGRSQKRTYLDIISCKDGGPLYLTESKGRYSTPKVKDDISKLKKLTNTDRGKAAVLHTLSNIDDSVDTDNILISVAFYSESNNHDDLYSEGIDFIIRIIPSENKWKIWTKDNDAIFSVNEGVYDINDVYKTKKKD